MGPRDESSWELLRVEYEKASDFAVHVDDVRNVITSLFLTLSAGGVIVLARYAGGGLETGPLGTPAVVASSAAFGVGAIGMLFVMTLARLRRVQLERYGTMNRILDACLIPEHRELVSFSDRTVVGGGGSRLTQRETGSYVWTMAVAIPASVMIGLGALVAFDAAGTQDSVARWISAIVALLALLGLDRLYLRWSRV